MSIHTQLRQQKWENYTFFQCLRADNSINKICSNFDIYSNERWPRQNMKGCRNCTSLIYRARLNKIKINQLSCGKPTVSHEQIEVGQIGRLLSLASVFSCLPTTELRHTEIILNRLCGNTSRLCWSAARLCWSTSKSVLHEFLFKPPQSNIVRIPEKTEQIRFFSLSKKTKKKQKKNNNICSES